MWRVYMNLRDLKYVLSVAEHHHFGKAAEDCFVSQPTLSNQIKKLEDELGVTIFERTNRSVEVTAVGKPILTHAQLILEQVDIIQQLARASQNPLSGSIQIGVIPTLSPYLMPLIFKPLKTKCPQMLMVLSEELTLTLIERLKKHEIDAALVASEVDEKEFTVIPLFREPFWLAYPCNHRFAKVTKISQNDLDNAELLLLAEGHCLAKQAMDVCHRNNRKDLGEMVDLRASSLETLLQMVSAGLGTTLVPALALETSWTKDNSINSCKLGLNNAFRDISLIYRKGFPRKQALDALIETIIENLPDSVEVAVS